MSVRCKKFGCALRPHAKSHKMSKICKLQIKEGAVGICVATLHEAEILSKLEINDMLLTSTIVDKESIARIIKLLKSAIKLSIVVDDIEVLKKINENCKANNVKPNVLVDIDIMGLSGRAGRTGVKNKEDLLQLAKFAKTSSNTIYKGVCAYAGDVQHIENYSSRGNNLKYKYKYLNLLVNQLKLNNLHPEIVSGGGTGSHEFDIKTGLYNEIQAGSYVFSDVEYDSVQLSKDKNFKFSPSLFVGARVVSCKSKRKAIINAGIKAFATDTKYLPKVMSESEYKYEYMYMGDEHGLITWNESIKDHPKLGQYIELQVPHCDPNVNLFNKCHVVNKSKLIDIWSIDARGYE